MDKLAFVDMGLSITVDEKLHNIFKMICIEDSTTLSNTDLRLVGVKLRCVYMIGIQSDQTQKWKLCLEDTMLASVEKLDPFLVEAKKKVFESQGIEYLGEDTDSDSQDGAATDLEDESPAHK